LCFCHQFIFINNHQTALLVEVKHDFTVDIFFYCMGLYWTPNLEMITSVAISGQFLAILLALPNVLEKSGGYDVLVEIEKESTYNNILFTCTKCYVK